MNEEIKEKLDLNPNNMNKIAKEAYYQLENYIFNLEKTQNNWNELKKVLKDEIERTNEIIKEDCNMVAMNNIRKMINNDREVWLFKMEKLEQGKDE